MERIGRWLQPGPVWPDARLAPERFPRLRRLALAFALVGPARHRLRRRCSSFVRVWPFPPCAGERKHSQTLNFTGGNTLWLTKNPSLKSASVASRPRSGRTEPKSNRGTRSPSLVSTKTTLVNGRRRRASGATTCCACQSGLSGPHAPLRASAGRRTAGRVLEDADLESGGAGPRRSPILPGSLPIRLHGWQTAPRNAVFRIF